MRRQYEGWGPVSLAWMIMSGFFAFGLFINVILGIVVGTVLGWVLSLTFLGTWIVEGLKAFRLDLQAGNLYQIGAAVGFLSSFFKYSIKMPTWNVKDEGKREDPAQRR
ncbi:MAG: hypothetical protein M0Z48_10280 [Nitrospiraceae bacterium]|nr:hypothetical protein [Nitrospiraceae bacterium]